VTCHRGPSRAFRCRGGHRGGEEVARRLWGLSASSPRREVTKDQAT
jgi:hypothetical protein